MRSNVSSRRKQVNQLKAVDFEFSLFLLLLFSGRKYSTNIKIKHFIQAQTSSAYLMSLVYCVVEFFYLRLTLLIYYKSINNKFLRIVVDEHIKGFA